MTLPASTAASHTAATIDTPPVRRLPAPGAATRLSAALDVQGLSRSAFHLYAGCVLRLPPGVWFSTQDAADAAVIGERTVRPLIAELIRAGLVQSRPMVVHRDGVPVRRTRYSIPAAVTA